MLALERPDRLRAAQNNFLQFFRPAARRNAENSGKHFDDRVWQREIVLLVELENVVGAHIFRHEKERHVADDLARWRDFHDVAEKLVDLSVGGFDFAPAMAESHGDGLLAQIRILAAGNLVLVETRGAGFRAGVERRVVGADNFPIVRAVVKRVDV